MNGVSVNKGGCGESARSTGPFLRYTQGYTGGTPGSDSAQPQFEDTSGWLVKQGRKTGQPIARFFQLHADRLSNHRNERTPPTWTCSMLDATVALTNRPNQLSLRLPTGRKFVLDAASRRDFHQWRYALRRAAVRGALSLHDFYRTGDVIGDGVSGQVLSGIDLMTGDTVAIKSLPLTPDDIVVTEEEISIATCLNHPNLIRTYDVFRDCQTRAAHLVMEFAAGGELRARVDTPEGPTIGEKDGVRIARNLLGALEYLHERGIVHRDIKLENVLCVHGDAQKGACVKLADFGSSAKLGSNRRTLKTQVGTSFYLAPEIIQKMAYGRPVDLWALGVLLYITLSGELPFPGTESDDYCRNAVNVDLEFPPDPWSAFSADARDFIRSLMDKNPHTRLTARDALKHAWITNPAIENIETSTGGESDDDDGGGGGDGNGGDNVVVNVSGVAHDDVDQDVSDRNLGRATSVDTNNIADNLPPLSLQGSLPSSNRRNNRGRCSSLMFGRRRTAQEILERNAHHS